LIDWLVGFGLVMSSRLRAEEEEEEIRTREGQGD